MQVGAALRQADLVRPGHAVIAAFLGRVDNCCLPYLFGFRQGLVREAARDGVGADRAGEQEVPGHAAELERTAAGHEADAVVSGQVQQFRNVRLGVVQHSLEFLAAVADFEDGHAAAAEIEQLRLHFL